MKKPIISILVALPIHVWAGFGDPAGTPTLCPSYNWGLWIGHGLGQSAVMSLSLAQRILPVSTAPCPIPPFVKDVQVSPPLLATAFDAQGKPHQLEIDQLKPDDASCARFTMHVRNGIPGLSEYLLFSKDWWRRLDKPMKAEDISKATWDMLSDRLIAYRTHLLTEPPDGFAVSQIDFFPEDQREAYRLSGEPARWVVMLKKRFPYGKGSEAMLVAQAVVDGHNPEPLSSWPQNQSIMVVPELDLGGTLFLGEYTNGTYRLVLLGDLSTKMDAVSVGPKQDILTLTSTQFTSCN